MLQNILSGLAIGAIYGLVALGFSVIFYVTRVINFAQGQVVMLGLLLTAVTAGSGWPIVPAIIVGILGSGAMSVLIYFGAVRPVLSADRTSYAWLVSTLGVALLLENGAALVWGTTSRSFPDLLDGTSVSVAAGARITVQEILMIVVAIVLTIVIELVLRRTHFGKLGMATAVDPEMATAVGINTRRVAVGAFLLAGLIAGVAGVLVGPRTFANPYLGETYGIDGFVALMIGGTDRLAAALVGGFILGVVEQLATAYINTQASGWFPFVVVVAVLIVLPEGLLSSGNPLERALGRLVPRRPKVQVHES